MNIILILASYHHATGLSESGKTRVKHAASILREETDSLAIVTAGTDKFTQSELLHHELVANELLESGISESRILGRLPNAYHTVGEAAYTCDLSQNVDYDLLKILTSFAHYPRAPFIFSHFFPIRKLHFVLVPGDFSKDVTHYIYFKEAEAYHVLRSQHGIYAPPNNTPFDHSEFSELCGNRTEIMLQELQELDADAGSGGHDLFSYFEPQSSFQ